MASSYSDNFGRVSTNPLNPNELIEQLSDALKANDITETKESDKTADPMVKIEAFIKSLPDKFYQAFSKDIDQIQDYIKIIADYDTEQRKNKTKDARRERERDNAFSSMEKLMTELQRNLGSGKGSDLSSSLLTTELSNASRELHGIRNATSSLAKLFGHKGSGYVHDIHVESLLNQWHKDWRTVQSRRDPTLSFEPIKKEMVKEIADPITGSVETLAKAVSYDYPPGIVSAGIDPISSPLLGSTKGESPLLDNMGGSDLLGTSGMNMDVVARSAAEAARELGDIADTTDKIVGNSESQLHLWEDQKNVLDTIEQLMRGRGQGRLSYPKAKEVKEYYKHLLAINKINLEDLEYLDTALRNTRELTHDSNKKLRQLFIEMETEKDIKKNAEELLHVYKKQGRALYEQGIEANGLKNILINTAKFSAANTLTQGVQAITSNGDNKALGEDFTAAEVLKNRRSAARMAAYTAQGLTKSSQQMADIYEQSMSTVAAVDEAGVSLSTYNRQFNKNMGVGLRNVKDIKRFTATTLNLSRAIDSNAESTADSLTRWHQETGFTTSQMSTLNQGIQQAARLTGVTGDNLMQAVEAAKQFAIAMRNAGTLTTEAANGFIRLMASAKKFGVERLASDMSRILSSSVEFQNAAGGMQAFLMQSAIATGRADMPEKVRTGQATSNDDRKAMTEGMESVLNSYIKAINPAASIDDLTKLTRMELMALNNNLKNNMGFELGEAKDFIKALKDSNKTTDDLLKDIDAKMAKNITSAERNELQTERSKLMVGKYKDNLAPLDAAVTDAPNMTEAFTRSGISKDDAKKNLTGMLDEANKALEKLGEAKIDKGLIQQALSDPQMYVDLMGKIADAQNKISTRQKVTQDPIEDAKNKELRLAAEAANAAAVALNKMTDAVYAVSGPYGLAALGKSTSMFSNALQYAFQNPLQMLEGGAAAVGGWFGLKKLTGWGRGAAAAGAAGTGAGATTAAGAAGVGAAAGQIGKLSKLAKGTAVLGGLITTISNLADGKDVTTSLTKGVGTTAGGLIGGIFLGPIGAVVGSYIADSIVSAAEHDVKANSERVASAQDRNFAISQKDVMNDSTTQQYQILAKQQSADAALLQAQKDLEAATAEYSKQQQYYEDWRVGIGGGGGMTAFWARFRSDQAVIDETAASQKKMMEAKQRLDLLQTQLKPAPMPEPEAGLSGGGDYGGGADFDTSPTIDSQAALKNAIEGLTSATTDATSAFLSLASPTFVKTLEGIDMKQINPMTTRTGPIIDGVETMTMENRLSSYEDMETLLNSIADKAGTIFTSMPANMEPAQPAPRPQPVPLGEEITETKVEQQLATVAPPSNVTTANQQLNEIANNTRETSEGIRSSNVILSHILSALNGSGTTNNNGSGLDTSTKEASSSAPTWPRLMFNYNGGARKRYLQTGV